MQFTIKFRHALEQSWIWANEEYGIGDGFVVLQDVAATSQKLEDLIPNLSSQWSISTHQSEAPDTTLWSLTTRIGPSVADESSFQDVEIGTPFTHFQKWFALVRAGIPWLAPRKGLSRFTLDKDGILCTFADGQGRHLVFLAMSGVDDILALIRSTDTNSISLHARNDAPVARDLMVLVSTGYEVDKAIAAVVYHARSLIWRYSQIHDAGLQSDSRADFQPKWRENWYDGLGYCTWNSLGQDLTEDKILEALKNLEESGISISNLIIDDNWQSIDASDQGATQAGLLEFEANRAGFPSGLKSTVSKIRRTHRTIEHIFVWHALLGYWGGISPRGAIARSYKTTRVRREDTGTDMIVIANEDISKFYDDFYAFMVQSGVDGVKTDAQCLLDTLASASARRALTNAYLDKWSIASLRHFGVNAISCMSQFPQALFHALLPQIRPPVTARNSDDYFPDAPSSHRWHVWANAHNAVLTQYLNVVPDWDMFQTAHEFADYHAAARCLSGGPVYITDVPGQHDLELLKRVTALTTLGKTVILRPSVVGIALDPYLDYDSGALLKIGSFHGEHKLSFVFSRRGPQVFAVAETDRILSGSGSSGISLMGVFQTSDAQTSSLTLLSEFRGISHTSSYVVRAYTTGRVSQPLRFTDGHGPSLLATPSDEGYEIYTAYELTCFASSRRRQGEISVASLGLVDKMTGCAAIEASHVEMDAKISITSKLKALGVLGLYVSSLPDMTIDDNFMVTIFGHPVPRDTVRISRNADTVLEVDVQTAWKELGLDSGWSNELEVTVNILRI
ncbi:raffinose synthase Sip1 [Beauveria brongniartii RCEF 3172]|uniref:Raffinose synthase Sip1 n=1 Tax=Beauveria brongniartii RCEF 3172 TaxID=1081107 RepID=A0A167EXE6_9HYPO|nr:raffinose synthase Sip1 [Beauveria brongniartii RCEF 3172]